VSATRRSKIADLLSVVAGAAVVLVGVGVVSPTSLLPAAYADMPKSCLDAHTGRGDDYGQIDAEENDGSTSDDLRGLNSDVWVAASAECQRISSVFVFSPSYNGFYEFGYVLGWSTCSGNYYQDPTVFSVWEPNSGRIDCTVWGSNHPSDGQTHNFRASDVNANTYWGGYLDGDALQPDGVNLDFARGHGGINMERGHPNDSGYADFQDIEEYHDGNGWTFTDDIDETVDIDPDYHLDVVNEHHGEMVHD
jgi:hypothetical protein